MRRRASGVEYAPAPAPSPLSTKAVPPRRAPTPGASASRHASAQSASAASAPFGFVLRVRRDKYSPPSSPCLRRASEIVAQEDADGDAHAVALGRAEVH